MTMHEALHPKSDVDRVYLSREMGGKGLISCERCIRMDENNLEWYDSNSAQPLIRWESCRNNIIQRYSG